MDIKKIIVAASAIGCLNLCAETNVVAKTNSVVEIAVTNRFWPLIFMRNVTPIQNPDTIEGGVDCRVIPWAIPREVPDKRKKSRRRPVEPCMKEPEPYNFQAL